MKFNFQQESPFYQSYGYRLYLVDNRKQTRFKFHCSDMVDQLQDGEISSMTHQCGRYGLVQSSFVLLYRWRDIDFSAHFFARHHIAVEIESLLEFYLKRTVNKLYPCAALARASFSFDSSTDVHGYRWPLTLSNNGIEKWGKKKNINTLPAENEVIYEMHKLTADEIWVQNATVLIAQNSNGP